MLDIANLNFSGVTGTIAQRTKALFFICFDYRRI